jgi:hypothetical protein
MVQLTQNAFDRAAEFILDNATNLHRERFRFHFESGSSDAVTDALKCHQNEDGGFAHGLESDLRTANSSVICTTVALQTLGEIGAAADSPLITSAMDYLMGQYRHENWPLINRDCNDAPHAPWWTYNPAWKCTGGRFLPNPGAEIIGYLLTYPNELPSQKLDLLLKRAAAHIETQDLEMHDLLCYQRLYECLDSAQQAALLPHLLRCAFELVKVDERDWEEYCLTPLDVIQYPDSLFTSFFGEYLQQNFEFQLSQQREDGSWQPAWSWGSEYPATWQVVEPAISAEVTLKFLLQLKNFGLLE